MLVQDLMVRNVVMVPSVATIRDVIHLMRQHHVKSMVNYGDSLLNSFRELSKLSP